MRTEPYPCAYEVIMFDLPVVYMKGSLYFFSTFPTELITTGSTFLYALLLAIVLAVALQMLTVVFNDDSLRRRFFYTFVRFSGLRMPRLVIAKTEPQLPGAGLDRLTACFATAKTYCFTLQPTIGDMQREYTSAMVSGHVWKARWVLLSFSCWTLWVTWLVAELVNAFTKKYMMGKS